MHLKSVANYCFTHSTINPCLRFLCVCAHCFNCLDSQLSFVYGSCDSNTSYGQPFGQKDCCLASIFVRFLSFTANADIGYYPGGMLRALQKCSCPKSFLRRRC